MKINIVGYWRNKKNDTDNYPWPIENSVTNKELQNKVINFLQIW